MTERSIKLASIQTGIGRHALGMHSLPPSGWFRSHRLGACTALRKGQSGAALANDRDLMNCLDNLAAIPVLIRGR